MKLLDLLRNYRNSFHFRVFLALLLVIVIFIPGTGYIGYLQALQVAEEQMEQYSIRTATQIADRVTAFLSQHTGNVRLLASLFANSLIQPQDEPELLEYFRLFKSGHPEFVNIYYGDEQGSFTMVPPQRPEVHRVFDPRTRPWYLGAKEDGKIHWTNIYRFASNQKPGLTVSAPIYHKGKLLGVCGIDIDLEEFSRFLQSIDIGNEGVAYIFENTSGRLIAHPSLTGSSGNFSGLELLHACRTDLDQTDSSFGLTEFGGQQYFTAFAPYPDRDWTVGVTFAITDYLEKIQLIKQTTVSLVIFATLLSTVLSYLLVKNIISPLNQLRQGIERITGGDLEHRVIIQGPDIAQDLARSFNRMASSLHKSLIELKATYHELQEKQKLAAVGKMTAGIAHEIKNPLGIILGSTQVVMDRNRPEEMREKAASFIMEEVVRLDNTLKAFLAFARPATPVFSEIDVIDLVRDMLSATEERYREEGYSFVCDFPERVPLFEGDPAQIRQIFTNIFMNSFQAMESGGTITVRIRAEKEPEMLKADKRFISIRNPFTVARFWVIISIEDEGCGITDEQLGKIMEPFVSFRDDGFGLGLSIVSQLVKLHRGHIQIESEVGSGSVFRIFFPCIIEEGANNDQPADH